MRSSIPFQPNRIGTWKVRKSGLLPEKITRVGEKGKWIHAILRRRGEGTMESLGLDAERLHWLGDRSLVPKWMSHRAGFQSEFRQDRQMV